MASISFTGVRWAWCIGMDSKFPSPAFSEEIRSELWCRAGTRVGGSGPAPESVQSRKWPIVSGSQGHDSEVREEGQRV